MAAAIAAPAASGLIGPTGTVRYMGLSLRGVSGGLAIVEIRDGGATGTILDVAVVDDAGLVALPAAVTWCGPNGKHASGQLYYKLVSGAAPAGSVAVA